MVTGALAVRCSRCQHENGAAAKFCEECGTALPGSCPRCGHAVGTAAKFCAECGHALAPTSAHEAGRDPRTYTPHHLAEKILGSRAALEGERKQVTVLFADVKGSMELAEQLDPEAWHRIMDRFLQVLTEGVHRFEGTVNQYTGDGIMALFGAPIAHEDHAQRACWAALHLGDALRRYAQELKREQGLGFSVRMGLNSGEVVVGKIGDDLRMDYTAQGHTVGLAARMEQLASPDTAYLSEHTAALVTGYFDLQDLGRFHVKGAGEPIGVFQLRGVGQLRTRLDVSRARGFSRFVGREDELHALEAALGRAIAGQGQVVGVVAEPGVGKSRLCYEFTQRSRARGVPVYEAHGVAHGKMVPFLPVLELLRNIHGVTEHDSPQAVREKVAGRLLLLDEGLRDGLPLVFDLLGVPDPERPLPRMDPEARQRQLFAVMQRAVQARSQREPAVYLFEDLHWLDGGSEAFVAMLVEATARTRTLLLVNFRPEYHAEWMRRSDYQQVSLLPLSAEATEELLRDLLGADPTLAPVTALIRARTVGNPFFVEEIVQTLVETGVLGGERGAYRFLRPVEVLALPASVQAGLAARIDRLPERERRLLQTAAVIGHVFAEPVLARVVPLPAAELAAALRALVAAEFLYQEVLYPEAVYAFKHPLTQEVAYRSQLAERRQAVHAAVARAIEGLYADRLDEHAALLAQHWEGAGEAVVAADWHRRAAEWVGPRDRGEMSRHWQRVRALLDTVPESAETLALGVLARTHLLHNGIFLGQADSEAATLFAEGMALANRLDGPAPRIFPLLEYGMRGVMSGAVDEGLAHLTQSLRLANESGNTFLQFMVRAPLTPALNVAGRPRDAVAASEEAERLCGGDPEMGTDTTGFSLYGVVLCHRARALAWLGYLGEAAATAARAIEIARRRQDAEVAVAGHEAGEEACELAGDVEGALGHGRQAVEAAATASWGIRAAALATLGRAHLLGGHWPQAVEAMTGALAVMRERRVYLVIEGWYLAFLTEASLGAGDPDGARETADLALARTRECRTRVLEIMALLAWVRVRLVTAGADGAAEIEAALRDAMALVETTEARAYAPFIHVERAALARLTGDDAARHRELREAHRLFVEIGAPIRAEQVARELA